MKSLYRVGIALAVIVTVVVVLFVVSYKLGSSPTTSTSPYGNVLLSLTDPANVPAGTQSLVINYNSLSVHTSGANGSGWTYLNASGSDINLLSLQNSSVVLDSFSLPNGTSINMIRFNVSKAVITINNTQYLVTLPSNQITAHINGSQVVNGTVRVLLDLAPTVITIVTANSTVFIMVPSVKAVIVPKPVSVIRTRGAVVNLSERERVDLADITPNITITSASLSTLNNLTSLQITVKDNSNASVLLRHVSLFGNESVSIPRINVTNIREIGHGEINVTERGNVTSAPILRANVTTSAILKTYDDVVPTDVAAGSHTKSELLNVGKDLVHMGMINFLVGVNGTLFLPFLNCVSATAVGSEGETVGASPDRSACPELVNYSDFNKGYILGAGQSATLSFNGSISLGQNTFHVKIVPGDNYKIVVQGERNARASINVTAS